MIWLARMVLLRNAQIDYEGRTITILRGRDAEKFMGKMRHCSIARLRTSPKVFHLENLGR